ncbi:RNA-directed DNA polymerase, eukaryota, reverse transcriptase zinc-binding domain protein [Tanacetum coccineum]
MNRSRIMSICDEQGKRFNYNEVFDQFVKHFEGFLGIIPEVDKFSKDDSMLFEKKVSSEKADFMIREISNDDIKKALFDIEDNKAPSRSFKKSWEIIKDDFCAAIKEFFMSGEAVGRTQCHSYCPYVPLKLIYRKHMIQLAGFFLKTLWGKFGFPRRMTDWIMACIANSKFSICVNGERYGYFKGGRGLRQGDPISSYIFTIVMEWLNLIMKDEIRKEKQFKFHFGCKQMRITHLCFADDLIMLCHGGVESVQTIKRALDKFSAMNPNLGKCIMFCGSLDSDTKNAINTILPFKEGKLPVSLSYAGRAQLIASVLASMQVYWGQCFFFLKLWSMTLKSFLKGSFGERWGEFVEENNAEYVRIGQKNL